MKNSKLRRRIVCCVLLFYLIGVLLITGICPTEEVSKSERRRLAERPKLTLDSLLDKSFMDDTEKYLLDHFPFRDSLRRVKAHFSYDVLRQKENNDIYVADGHASKLEFPLRKASLRRLTDKMTSLQQKYFPDQAFYYTIVPDKNYFLAAENGYPAMDYGYMLDCLSDTLEAENGARYIDIISGLSIDDYYHTDTHWRQERLFGTAQTIAEAFGAADSLNLQETNFNAHEIEDFYGVYYGQAALPMEADTIVYLTNEATEAALVWSLEDNLAGGSAVMPDEEGAVLKSVYQMEKLTDEKSLDKYDIFAGGASSLQIIRSPKVATGKRLIVFRDSYASSLAPLLLGAYREIVLIDLRYMNSELLGSYVDFSGADILFLYNTLIVNQAEMLK